MIVFKRRLVIWLIRAYIKKWGKIISVSFVGGLAIFFILFWTSGFLLKLLPLEKKTVIGVAGNYTADALPSFVLDKISLGLTTVDAAGHIQTGLAKSWTITDKGHTYTFHLRANTKFSDGTPLTSKDINYSFTNVKISRPDPGTIVYHLHEVYAPFLVTVSRPVLKDNYVGAGGYKLENLNLNGPFVKSLTLVSVKNKLQSQEYIFYNNPDVLKTAFLLGEVTTAYNLTDTQYKTLDLAQFPNTDVQRTTDYSQMVALFMNTQDDILSDNKIRSAISYAIPDSFKEGERAFLPYPPKTWYYNQILTPNKQDFTHSKLLIGADSVTVPTLTIRTLTKYASVARQIADSLKKAGIKTKIIEVDSIPAKFQLYLGDFMLPNDPDQYALWHENQANNITLLNDKRIDKLLEDGRQTTSEEDRKQIYDDFQKFLTDRVPAVFLYFPYNYTVSRN